MKNVLELIRGHEFYTGDRSIHNKVSVTEISGSDVLQMYLARRFPDAKEPDKVGQNTLGSIFDGGMRDLVAANGKGEDVDIENGVRFQIELPNGFILSGEPDVIDNGNKWIVDTKLSKMYAVKMMGKEGAKHQYAQQVNYYRLDKRNHFKMFILWGLKDQSDVKKDHPTEAMVLVEVPKINDTWLIQNAVEKTEELKLMLETDNVKAKCDDTWANDMRCKSYCDKKSVCPYAKKRGYNGAGSW